MLIRFELTRYLSDMAGFRQRSIEIAGGTTVAEALTLFSKSFSGDSPLLSNGALHPSLLVVVNGAACTNRSGTYLSDGQVIHLMLPSAGG